MKRKLSIVAIAVVIVAALIIAVVDIISNNKLSEEGAIEGIVLNVDETRILINKSGYESGKCYLIVSDNTEIYVEGKKTDISSIEVGQTVQAAYVGEVDEIYPSVVKEVTKITIK